MKNTVSMQEYQHLTQFFHQCSDLFFWQGDLCQTCTVNVFLYQCNIIRVLLHLNDIRQIGVRERLKLCIDRMGAL